MYQSWNRLFFHSDIGWAIISDQYRPFTFSLFRPAGEPVEVMMRPGDVVVAHQKLPHLGMPNLCPDVRYQVATAISNKCVTLSTFYMSTFFAVGLCNVFICPTMTPSLTLTPCCFLPGLLSASPHRPWTDGTSMDRRLTIAIWARQGGYGIFIKLKLKLITHAFYYYYYHCSLWS